MKCEIRNVKLVLSLISYLSFHISFSQNTDSLLTLLKKGRADTNKVRHLNALAAELRGNKPDTAITLNSQALELSAKLKYEAGTAVSHHDLGYTYFQKGDYPKALEHYLDALSIWEKKYPPSGGKEGAVVLSSLGILYYNQGDAAKALDYFLQVLKQA